jgi:hypothetical protein
VNTIKFLERSKISTELLFIFISGILLIPITLTAQEVRTVNAHQLDSSIQIDGHLDEEAWSQAEIVTDFRQFSPDEGAPATQQTEVRILYGEGGIYVGAMLYDDNPALIERTLGRRDDFNRADWFVVSFDSYFNRQNAYTFAVNAAGIQYDGIRSGGGGGGSGLSGVDESWDAVWYSEVRITNEGWIVEMQIPYSMLRFPEIEIQTWGIHFTRRIPRLGEQSEWPLVPRVERDNLIAQYGRLQNIRNIEPRPNIQVRPYLVGGYNSHENSNIPGEVSKDFNVDVGGDIKVGLGPNVTLDATINPDFGQVEADPAVLNLTAFESFFQEQRPFFLEGIEIFDFSMGRGADLLYTRRIGSVDPIIGATKLSGRTENGLSFGVFGAVTGENFNPARNYSVVRGSQQIGNYSSVGGILTFYDSPTRLNEGRRRSYVGGTDWDFRFADNNYGIRGFATFTHRTLTGVDESELGFAASFTANKRQGVWMGSLGAEVFSDEFNPNDLGRLRRNNVFEASGRIEHQINGGRPFGTFQRADADASFSQNVSYNEGLDLGFGLRTGSDWTFKSFQSVEVGVNLDYIFGGYDQFETRGLGPRAKPFSAEIDLEYETDDRRTWQLSPESAWTFYDDGGSSYSLGLRANMNVGSRLDFSANVGGEWEKGVIAWASNESFRRSGSAWLIGESSARPSTLSDGDYRSFDDGETLNSILSGINPFSDNDYYVSVFGERDTRSLDFTFRSTVTFTRNLSLQIYNQLFLAKGKYENFKILQDRDTLADFSSYPKRDEFSFNSFHSNVVLRWEYRPGSTVFLVWSHGRDTEDQINPLSPFGSSPYDRPIGSQIGDTFDIIPNNSVLLKINYTFLY